MAVEDIRNQLYDARTALEESASSVSSTSYEVTLRALLTDELGQLAGNAVRLRVRFEQPVATEAAEQAADLLRETATGTRNPVLERAAGAAAVLHENVDRLSELRPVLEQRAQAYSDAMHAAHLAADQFGEVLVRAAELATNADLARVTADDEANRYLDIIGR